MPDNKSLQQQAEEYANKHFDRNDYKTEGLVSRASLWKGTVRDYLACATKYISEIEARDKRIEELLMAMSDINANLILGNTKAAFDKTYEILTAFHPSKENKKGENI
jgi:hypothetical protein